jgi:5'-nucleotidase
MRRPLAVLLTLVLAAFSAAPAAAKHNAKRDPRPSKGDPTLRLLAINDFHGNLEPPTGSGGRIQTGPTTTVDAGGATFLATHAARLRKDARDSMLVSAGDLIGASPLISGLFHDEPTIEALNAMDLRYNGVGNHEFDEGIDELMRMQRGGCHPVDGCQDGDPFLGASFRFLASNVRWAGTQRTIFPPFWIKLVKGIPVVVMGLTLEDTPKIVTPEGVAGLEFDDEADTINRYVRLLAKATRAEAFVILIHQGGQQNAPGANGFIDANRCDNFTGDIGPIVDRLDKRVDVVLSAHTHQPYICKRNGMLLTSAASFGRLITKVDLTLDRRTRDVKSETAENVIVTRDVPEDPAVKAIVDKYKAISAPIAGRVVGRITAAITRDSNPAGESALGDVIADAQLESTAPADKGAAKVAFMNPGGIRADLPFNAPAGDVTYNDLFTVQPFANTLVVKTMTGAQIKALLEQQFDNPSAGQRRILQVSAGLTYTYDTTQPAGSRVGAIQLGGTPVDPAASYRVTMNSFLATGGDGFTVFNQGTDQLGGDVDIDALEGYIGAHSPVAPGPRNRIVQTG